ncbi:hypothetical protein GCM10010517_23070 [Streptosporangium fragile]|uniref:FXSXX-COOH protein n=1 Tax=Streptosporangium fragile TaxID=46186 RepID=A0ABN3VXJ8_9ACTN
MHYDGPGATASLDLTGLTLEDLARIDSAAFRRVLSDWFLRPNVDLEASAGFDSSI